MNIIHLVRAVTWGGGERYALDLCKTSIEAGHRVTVATKGVPLIDSRFSDFGAKIEHLPLGGPFDLISPFRLAKIICSQEDKVVVVHVHTFKDAEIAARAKVIIGNKKKVRLICTRHLVKPGKRSWRWGFIYRHIDKLIFVSDLAKKVFIEGRPNINNTRITLIYNSIIPPPQSKAQSYIKHSQSREPNINILFTGRISPEKGVETLIHSLTFLADLPINLRIVGSGSESYLNKLKAQAQKLGVSEKIDWLGFIPDVYREIRSADICVAPSLWREPFGLTIIEFMSQSKPVITSNNGAQSEIITSGHDGILIPPSDPDALADAIRNLATDPDLRNDIGANASKTFANRFAYGIFFNKIMDAYVGNDSHTQISQDSNRGKLDLSI